MPPLTTTTRSVLQTPFVIPAIILGVALVFGTWSISYALYAIRGMDNTLTATGSAHQSVTANMGKWRVSISRNTSEEGVSLGYTEVARQTEVAKTFFAQQGIEEKDITASIVTADQDYSYNPNGVAPKRYNVHQELTIESNDVEKIHRVSQLSAQLMAKGVAISPQQPEYYVTNLPELRVQLIGRAIEDAKARASQIAQSGGASVGKLKSASSGVVQVLAPNSMSVDDYGAYDTSTIEKDITVTARATFIVK